jgi:hypothetical protein
MTCHAVAMPCLALAERSKIDWLKVRVPAFQFDFLKEL